LITTNNPISDLENIDLLDKCNDVMLVAKTMREAGDFLIRQRPNQTAQSP